MRARRGALGWIAPIPPIAAGDADSPLRRGAQSSGIYRLLVAPGCTEILPENRARQARFSAAFQNEFMLYGKVKIAVHTSS